MYLSMSAQIMKQSCLMDRSSSFFKLIDTFSTEISELKQEMVQPAREPETEILRGVEGEVSGLFLQSSECAGAPGVRDSGYDSLRRRMSILDRLMQTHSVWLLLSLGDEEARRILHPQPAGSFVVRRSAKLQKKVISLRMDSDPLTVRDFPVKESQYTFSLEGSGISFADLFRLVAFCCISRDVLPFTLKLPEAITVAKTPTDLEEVAQLGRSFWDSEICKKRKCSVSWETVNESSQQRPKQWDFKFSPRDRVQAIPITRTPSQLECSQSNGALCFINPLFLQTHQPNKSPNKPDTLASPDKEGTSQPHHSAQNSTDHPQNRDSRASSTPNSSKTSVSRSKSESHSPPPRPPPPRFTSSRSPSLHKQKSMPETVGWIKTPQDKSSLLGRLGSSFSSLSPSSSPPKRFIKPILVPSFRNKNSSSLLDADGLRCQMALDDQTIEDAISWSLAKRSMSNSNALENSSPADEHSSTRRERLSDISISTSSSDSLDLTQSFSLPTEASPSRTNRPAGDSSLEEEEEEEDDGINLESDQEVSPPLNSKKQSNASMFVLPRTLRGHLRKMSSVLNSLMTPERRAIRKIVEQSRDKGTYFGCLVQDYVSFLQENRGCHTSGLDLLQTLRQFMTQMKSYLLQSSELNPPIESLIPEDQIDHVMEKAMHKCVLKPLKPVIEAALQDFQVSSGMWQQLKENLVLAKAKKPQEMGVDRALPPDPVAIEKIRHKFHNMCKMYSPEKKVSLLLSVCKLIYTIMESNSGRMYGADDFLPMLTFVMAQCDMPRLDAEIQYMMELLDPSLLHGEGGYYLTSAYGAMSLIKNFQEDQAARVLSSETRNTLHQWHRRRTTQRTTPSVDDFQNYLRVARQDANNGCTAKTLQVQPYATTEDVCQICADKFKVLDPENYALFLLTDETTQQLAPDTHPQKIKAELHSRPQPQMFYFVYRQIQNLTVSSDQLNGNTVPN
ncbi:ras and Rab interactor 2-like isoform X1 [Myxocyprinus asiaticus]|uniref:ras and Rab interactor 2-like isoform X1 n=2 Tax=Myxocyprinus asiaticus TaxID=70543 RepID=UPI0022224584|nr:ras and Rab interactor 2-like isoform X1 [Myxocyprinus asiaticus]XP_051508244.1 ras and Rab interactor 2-like isoform X1 [Myxocyprinus asiaticus]XP_051508245.1 ras and Rab interactor 2-like isoform X1 [Myxocyprinus asiaticus]XP_051508246.1 ras and Rab interactor 2-like isoform X1 [Myxocyprinus asiaticus]